MKIRLKNTLVVNDKLDASTPLCYNVLVMKNHNTFSPSIADSGREQGFYRPQTRAISGAERLAADRELAREMDTRTFEDVHRSISGPGSEVRSKHKPSRAAIAMGVAATVAGGAHLIQERIGTAHENPVHVYEAGEVPADLPNAENTVIHITQPNETADGIAQELTPAGKDYRELSHDIAEAAKGGEDPGLDPGDRVIIEK